jgi:hypothetical protein
LANYLYFPLLEMLTRSNADGVADAAEDHPLSAADGPELDRNALDRMTAGMPAVRPPTPDTSKTI